jgi:hypothetical protein
VTVSFSFEAIWAWQRCHAAVQRTRGLYVPLCLIPLAMPACMLVLFSPILPGRPCPDRQNSPATGIGNGVSFLAFMIVRTEWNQTGLSSAAEGRLGQDHQDDLQRFSFDRGVLNWTGGQEVVSATSVCSLNFFGWDCVKSIVVFIMLLIYRRLLDNPVDELPLGEPCLVDFGLKFLMKAPKIQQCTPPF